MIKKETANQERDEDGWNVTKMKCGKKPGGAPTDTIADETPPRPYDLTEGDGMHRNTAECDGTMT